MLSFSNKQKKINETKLNIFRLATECTEEISSNRRNLEKSEIIKSLITKYKSLLLKISNSTNSKNEIKKDLIEINNQIKLKNIEIQMKNLKIEEKIKKLKSKIEKNFFNSNNEIDLLKETNFLLENGIKEKNHLINLLKNNLKQSKDHFIFREEIRENILENKIEGENFFFDYLFNLQEFLHFKCKKFNFFYNKNIQNLKTKLNLINTINYIKNQKNIKKLFDLNSNQFNQKNLLKIFKRSNSFEKKFLTNEDNNNNNNNKNSKIDITNILNSFLTIDQILTSNENNNIIIEEDLNSDEEFSFPNKIKYKFAEYKNIPSLNLKQIEYNKYKNQKEIDLYSKERRINSDQNEEQIKLIKKNIKKIKKNIKQNEIKIKNFQNVINEFKNNIILLSHFRNNSFNFNKNIFINKNNIYLKKKQQNKIDKNNNIKDNNSIIINEKINNKNIFINNDNIKINNSF